MNTKELLNSYQEVKECDFKGEHYSVRDNGAVYRHARQGKKLRKDDNCWTFGTPNAKNGYMFIGGIVRIHQIVATAFFGERDTKVYVVDHKDSNRRNNRVENLHWLTRLENILANPATRKKIIMCCGSLDAFLSNPLLIRQFANQNPDFSWMRTVSAEEAKQTLANMNEWAYRPIQEPKGGNMGDWIYKSYGFKSLMETMKEPPEHFGRMKPVPVGLEEENKDRIIVAKSPETALQKDWKTPTDFPLCPTLISKTPLQDYYHRLSKGALFTQNIYGGTTIVDAAISDDGLYIWVLGKRTEENPIKPWTLTGISFNVISVR